MFELINREISRQRSLFTLLTDNPYSNIRSLNHTNIVASIAYTQNCFFLFLTFLYSSSESFLLAG